MEQWAVRQSRRPLSHLRADSCHLEALGFGRTGRTGERIHALARARALSHRRR